MHLGIALDSQEARKTHYKILKNQRQLSQDQGQIIQGYGQITQGHERLLDVLVFNAICWLLSELVVGKDRRKFHASGCSHVSNGQVLKPRAGDFRK